MRKFILTLALLLGVILMYAGPPAMDNNIATSLYPELQVDHLYDMDDALLSNASMAVIHETEQPGMILMSTLTSSTLDCYMCVEVTGTAELSSNDALTRNREGQNLSLYRVDRVRFV